MDFGFAMCDVPDLFKERVVGEPVNVHVLEPVAEPELDFEEMRRVVQGDTPIQAEPVKEQ